MGQWTPFQLREVGSNMGMLAAINAFGSGEMSDDEEEEVGDDIKASCTKLFRGTILK